MLRNLSHFLPSQARCAPLAQASQLPRLSPSPLSVFRPSTSGLFNALQAAPNLHRGIALGAAFKALPGSGIRAFSSQALDSLALPSTVAGVKAAIMRFKFADKLALDQTSTLKDGRQVQVRRLNVKDIELICDFYARARPWGMFDHLATPENRVNNICSLFFNAASLGSDALVAIVGGKIVGLSEYEDQPGEMEEMLDRTVVHAAGYDADEVCIAKTMVLQTARDYGVGTALKRGQMQSAETAGYKAIAGRSYNAAVLKIVLKMGGQYDGRSIGSVWSVIPVPELAAKVMQA